MTRDTDKSHLFPPFAELLTRFEAQLLEAKLPFHLFEGLRSWDKQDVLYQQGRTTPGKVVTWALPGSSWHQYGMAADFVLDSMPERPGMQWAWDLKSDLNHDGRRDWEQMAQIAVQCGLESGWYWRTPDPPHVQHRFGLTIELAVSLYRSGGVSAVWAEAEQWIENQQWP